MFVTCETPHTPALIESGRCSECGQEWCENCSEPLSSESDVRFEVNGPGEPSYQIKGCVACLPDTRVRRSLGYRGDWAW